VLGLGILLSVLAHGVLGAGFYWRFHAPSRDAIVAELDLSLSPLSAYAGRAGGGGKPSEAWLLPPKGKKAPPPPPPAPEAKVPDAEEVKAADESACYGDNCTGEGKGSGPAVGDGNGVIEAVDAAKKPRWIRNMITSADYPRLARQAGKDGLVVLEVLLDDKGRVQDARLLQGGYEALNEVALRKVRAAVFTPARRQDGTPAACRVVLPIRFELR
jgi:TonB family protein